MTLKEIFDKYAIFDVSDEEIIKRYYIDNHAEHAGIELMNQLAQEQVQLLRKKLMYWSDWTFGLQVVLYNEDINEQDKLDLYSMVYTFTFQRDLNEEELEKANKIFLSNHVKYCPAYFIAYLQENTKDMNILDTSVVDVWNVTVQLVRELRNI